MTNLTVPDTVKMIRETLCIAQSAIHYRAAAGRDQDRADRDVELIGRIIAECDRQRPLGPDGKHGDGERCTRTCGCERPTAQRAVVQPRHDWWLNGGPEDLLRVAIDHVPLTVLRGPLAELLVKEFKNGVWWLEKVKPMWTDVEWVEMRMLRCTFESAWGERARAALELPVVHPAPPHTHTDEHCGHLIYDLEVEGATACAHCGEHYVSSEWCPERCEVEYDSIIASVVRAELNENRED